jgi:hypothetical protein
MAAGGPNQTWPRGNTSSLSNYYSDVEIAQEREALKEWLSIVKGLNVKEKDPYDYFIYGDWLARREQYTESTPLFVEIGDLMLAAGGDDPTEKHPVVEELLDELPLRSLDIAWFLCFMTVATKHPSLTLSEASSRLMPFLGESYFGFPSDYESMFDTWMTEYEDKVDRVLVTAGISK